MGSVHNPWAGEQESPDSTAARQEALKIAEAKETTNTAMKVVLLLQTL